jgi:hypothetical protein
MAAVNMYKEVIDGVIQPNEILHGMPHKNISWGKTATPEEYAAENLYLVVEPQVEIDPETERITGFEESIDETLKQIIRAPVIEPIPSSEILETQKAAIKQAYSDTLSEGCPTSFGFRVDCMPSNQLDFSGAFQIMQVAAQMDPTVTTIVRDYDNQNHVMTFQEYTQLCLELGMYVTQKRQEMWAAIDALAV